MGESDHQILMQGVAAWGQPDWLAFRYPREILRARRIDEVQPLLRAVEQATGRGRWAVGFVCYEAAAAFDPALRTHPPGPLPLAWFALFDTWEPAAAPGPPPELTTAPDLAPALTPARHAAGVETIKACIARGATYQVNYTFPLRGSDSAAPADRFAALYAAQQCAYAAFIETSEFAVASVSPELFFRQTGERLECRPMKGTAPRGRWPDEDAAFAARLHRSEKDRAENIMIVDMMRNDLGRIARPGSVRTRSLFEVERLPTVWQMTSTVEAESTAGLPEIFAALFPCASVTGAPKVQTMRIIHALETGPRGLYTGAIGLVGPERRAQFNVAIRTLVRLRGSGETRYDTGSGIVWDSVAANEYAECMAKARVLTPAPEFQLITTLKWTPDGGPWLWERHMARLDRSAGYYGVPFERAGLEREFRRAAERFPNAPLRVRVLISRDGSIAVEHRPLIAIPPSPLRVAWARNPVVSTDPFLFHKTTRRAVYEAARAERADADDVLLWNEAGEVTETSIANVAVFSAGRWTTPPIRDGLLGGVMREELIARGDWVEGALRREEIAVGTELQLANAVRGVWTARLVE